MPAVVMSTPQGNPGLSGKLTFQVSLCSVIAAFGGLMFGYDIGISGGVTSMDSFLIKFFHNVYEKKHRARENNYCKFNDQMLQLFTSSLYLAAIVASFIASVLCKKLGRRPTMQLASLSFLIGAVLQAAARERIMLIIGRVCLGIGVGFGNQAVPLFISEIAPANHRGGLNIMFQLLITVGILCANMINFETSKMGEHGWRYSLGGAVFPAAFLLLGSLFIVETPASLIERGKMDQGLATLQKIRGVDDVDKEFEEIKYATELAKKVKRPFRNLMKRQSRPQLICGTIFQVFQQFTGINVVMFYAPVLFQTMGFGADASLFSAVITGGINVVATTVAIMTVDKFGRRVLLIEAVVQMLICQVAIGVLLFMFLKATNVMPVNYAHIVVALICIYVAGFAWSWGPLGWLVASEIYPLETRSAGFFFAVSMNMACTFVIAQAFLSMLCKMKAAIFFFFSAWIIIMGMFAMFWLPETKGIPIDEMNERAWKRHWYWKRYFRKEEGEVDAKEDDDQPSPSHETV